MLVFLEEYLQKKVKVAEYLYLYGKDFSREEASKTIGLSTATLNQYVTEIYEDFCQEYQGGILLNSHSLEKVSHRLFQESKKLKALRMLLEKPGECANYYTDKLMISSASFSRIIASLKEDLSSYKIQILIKNGYRIEGEDEFHIVALTTLMASFYQWPVDDLAIDLATLIGRNAANEVINLADSEFPKEMDRSPYNQYRMFLIRYLIRKYQKRCALEQCSIDEVRMDYKEFLAYLNRLVQEAQKKVHQAMPKIIANCYPEGIHVDKKVELETLLVQVLCDYTAFPYEIMSVSMRMVFFNEKYRANYPNRIPTVDTLIYRLSSILRVDLNTRYQAIFYNVLTKNLLVFTRHRQVSIQVYSSVGFERNDYLKEQLLPLMGYFSKGSTLDMYDPSVELPKNKETLFITTDVLPKVPKGSQFLISDFISLPDYLSIMVWILEKMRFESRR